MVYIRDAVRNDQTPLEEFLAFNNGEDNRALAQAYIACMFSRDYRRPHFVVACDDGRIIGAAAYSEEFFTVGVWGISWVSVHPDYRSRGIGQALIEECLKQIAEKVGKAVTVILATYPGKTGLYERCGFIETDRDHEGGSLMIRSV